MATSTYLSNPTVLIGAVDCSDQCSSATLTVGYDSLESTAFGDTGHRFTQGLQSVEVTLTMFASYGASEMEATLYAQLGTGTTTVTISPAGTVESASNPEYVISNLMLSSFTPINATVGELSVFEITMVGGTFVRDIVSP